MGLQWLAAESACTFPPGILHYLSSPRVGPQWVLQLSVGGLPPDILQYLSSPRVSLQIRSGLRSKSVRHISVRIHTHLQTIPATPTVLLQAFRCVSCLHVPGSKMKHGCPKRKAYHMWGSPGRVIYIFVWVVRFVQSKLAPEKQENSILFISF